MKAIRRLFVALGMLGIALSLSAGTVLATGVQTLTASNYKSIISATSGTVVVDFSMQSCGPCHSLTTSGLLTSLGSTYTVAQLVTDDTTGLMHTITSGLGISDVPSYPTVDVFVNGALKGSLTYDPAKGASQLSAWKTAIAGYASTTGTTGTTGTAPPVVPVISNPPNASHECHLVLVTVTDTDKKGITDCDNISFNQYLSSGLTSLMPYFILTAVILIAYSGIQYMLSGVGGDVKQAKTRIFQVLSGTVLLMLISLILNQIEPGLNTLDSSGSSTTAGGGSSPITNLVPNQNIAKGSQVGLVVQKPATAKYESPLRKALQVVGLVPLATKADTVSPLNVYVEAVGTTSKTLIGSIDHPSATDPAIVSWDTSALAEGSYQVFTEDSATSTDSDMIPVLISSAVPGAPIDPDNDPNITSCPAGL